MVTVFQRGSTQPIRGLLFASFTLLSTFFIALPAPASSAEDASQDQSAQPSSLSSLPKPAAQERDPALEDARQLLLRFEALNVLRASFKQQMRDEQGQLLDESEGEVLWMRPMSFRWDVHSPFAQSIVINNGKHYQYDIDLEQLIVRELSEAVASLPTVILAGELQSLTEKYDVKAVRVMAQDDALSAEGGQSLYRLMPKASDADEGEFAELLFAFQGERLVEISLLDRLGQTSRFELETSAQQGVVAEDFEIEVPDSTLTVYQ